MTRIQGTELLLEELDEAVCGTGRHDTTKSRVLSPSTGSVAAEGMGLEVGLSE